MSCALPIEIRRAHGVFVSRVILGNPFMAEGPMTTQKRPAPIPSKGSDPCAPIDSHLQTTCKEECPDKDIAQHSCLVYRRSAKDLAKAEVRIFPLARASTQPRVVSAASTDGGHQHPQQRTCLPSVSVFILGRLGARSLQATSVPSSWEEKRLTKVSRWTL